uniref:B double prime 1, subunit of RNA polymerase III transcription initiation factor IIIB n=1 Tax=Sphenodon punctatus TaxID=8508 RepID=A0A8D0G596_SPHPU
MANKKSSLQEGNKHSVLKPASLMRGRMQRPKPNIGRTTERREVAATKKDVEEKIKADSEEEKTKAVDGEAEKSLVNQEHKSSILVITDDATNPGNIKPCSVVLEEMIVGSEKVTSMHTSQHSSKKPLGSENCEQEEESLSVGGLEDVSGFTSGGSSSQEEKKDPAQTVQPLRSRFQKPKPNLGKAAGRREVPGMEKNISEVRKQAEKSEKSLIRHDHEHNILPHPDITKCKVLLSSQSLRKEDLADLEQIIVTQASHQSPKKSSDSECGAQSESSLSADDQEKASPIDAGKQNSQGETIPSSLLSAQRLRSRFQRPKPNLQRAVGRKETQATATEETVRNLIDEHSELQNVDSANIFSTVSKLKNENEAVSADTSMPSLMGCEKVTQQGDSQVTIISQNISDEHVSEKPSFQGEKQSAVKPTQLVKGWYQRARPNLGRASEKKEDPAAEEVPAPAQGEVGRIEESHLLPKETDLHLSPKAEEEFHTSLGDLGKDDDPKSIGVALPKRSIDSEKPFPPEKSLEYVNLRDRKQTCTSSDVELRLPDNSASFQEESKQSIKPAQLVRGRLRRPKPNVIRATRKKPASSEEETITEDKTEAKETDKDLTTRGNKTEKLPVLVHHSDSLVETVSSLEGSKRKASGDSIEALAPKRSRQSGKFESESKGQVEQGEGSWPLTTQEEASDKLTRRQPVRSLKQIGATSSTSECESDHVEKGRPHRNGKPNVTKGKGLRPHVKKKSGKEYGSSKVTLVTLRASQEEDEDDADDFEPDYEEEFFSPEEVNKAPVFVPVGLRSPKPVSVQVEETMEELEISVNVPDAPCVTTVEYLSHDLNVAVQPGIQKDESIDVLQAEMITCGKPEKDTGISDGSAEAAMTLLAMRDPVFQLKISSQEQGKRQEFPGQDELNVADIFTDEHNEQNVICNNQPLSTPMKNGMAILDSGNQALQEDKSTGAGTGSGECLKDNIIASSDLSVPKENNTTRMARCRFPKPKPNLSRVLGKARNAHSESPSLSAGVEQSHQFQNVVEGKTPRDTIEEVELKLDEPAESNSADLHDLRSENTDHVKQVHEIERTENQMRETQEDTVELKTPVASPKTEIYLHGPESDPSKSFTTEFPEKDTSFVGQNLHEVQVAQSETSIQEFQQQYITSTEETAVPSDIPKTLIVGEGISDCPEKEEEQTFILTLVKSQLTPKNTMIQLLHSNRHQNHCFQPRYSSPQLIWVLWK